MFDNIKTFGYNAYSYVKDNIPAMRDGFRVLSNQVGKFVVDNYKNTYFITATEMLIGGTAIYIAKNLVRHAYNNYKSFDQTLEKYISNKNVRIATEVAICVAAVPVLHTGYNFTESWLRDNVLQLEPKYKKYCYYTNNVLNYCYD